MSWNAAAAELLAAGAQVGEVGARARAELEEPGLAGDEVEDAAFVHQVVGDALDEAGVRLRVGVGISGALQLAGLANGNRSIRQHAIDIGR